MAVADILVSPAKVYRAPTGEAQPDETSVGYGVAWGGNWVDMGYTLEPLSMSFEPEVFELYVQQLTNPVKRTKTAEKLTLETVLAEFTGANLAIALDGTNTPTAAGAGQKAFSDIKAGGSTTISEYQFGFEGVRPDSAGTDQPVRIFIHKGTAVLGGQLQFAKGEAVGIPLRIEALADTGKAAGAQLIEIQIVTAPAT